MKFKIILTFQFLLFASFLKAQECELITLAANRHLGKNFEYAYVVDKYDKLYDVENKNIKARITKILKSEFTSAVADSLCDLISNYNKSNLDGVINCNVEKIKLVSYNEALLFYEKNIFPDKEGEDFKKYEHSVILISKPIFYKNYLIIQHSDRIRRTLGSTLLILYKKINGEYKEVSVLYSF